MKYFKQDKPEYIVGRSNLALTIFVPYDCPNHCPFCTSKSEYANTENFNIDKITASLKKIGNIRYISDIVITGGEPFADLTKLQYLLDHCKHYHKNHLKKIWMKKLLILFWNISIILMITKNIYI